MARQGIRTVGTGTMMVLTVRPNIPVYTAAIPILTTAATATGFGIRKAIGIHTMSVTHMDYEQRRLAIAMRTAPPNSMSQGTAIGVKREMRRIRRIGMREIDPDRFAGLSTSS